jgi:mono/diheme cytochrome c family protein
VVGFVCVALVGCGEQQMARQPSYRPLTPSKFFPDDRSARPLVPGTVARGHLEADTVFYTGRSGKTDKVAEVRRVIAGMGQHPLVAAALLASAEDPYTAEFPIQVTKAVLERGRERFNIFCSACHGRTGDGDGIVKRRGFTPPPSYHIPRLREARPGYFFHVITHGYGAMPDHASQVPPRDRWCIAAYIRALQFSQNATRADVPPRELEQLEKEGGAAP